MKIPARCPMPPKFVPKFGAFTKHHWQRFSCMTLVSVKFFFVRGWHKELIFCRFEGEALLVGFGKGGIAAGNTLTGAFFFSFLLYYFPDIDSICRIDSLAARWSFDYVSSEVERINRIGIVECCWYWSRRGGDDIFLIIFFFLWEAVTGWPVHPNAKVVLWPDSLFVLKKA